MKSTTLTLILCLILAPLLPSYATAQPNQFTDEASRRAFSAIYAVDNVSFKACIGQVTDKAKASFLREYMALMNFTAANNKSNYNAYIQASDQAFDDVSGSAYEANLLCQLHIHKCMVYMYSGSMISGGIQFWKSYQEFKTAEKKYPNYDGQLPFRGIYNILFSQIPEKWKSLKGLLGLGDGNLSLGFKQIEEYRQKVSGIDGIGDEALVFSFANMFFSHDQNLTDQLTHHILASEAPVVRYAYILSCGRRQMGSAADSALHAAPPIINERFPLFYQQMGKYALRRQSLDETIEWAQIFISKYRGASNLNDAYLQMTYAYLLKGDRTKAQYYADKALAIPYDFDIDRRTHEEATKAMQIDVMMLRARLQFEYGHFAQSKNTLNSFTPRKADTAEYYFRLGRAEERLENNEAALSWYNKTIEISTNSTDYYGPYAAVYAADIKLEMGDTKAAQAYIDKATKLYNGEYKKELDQRIELTNRAIKKQGI